MTMEELKALPPGTRLIWQKDDNTRFRPQPKMNISVTLLRVTASRGVVATGAGDREHMAAPEWLSPDPGNPGINPKWEIIAKFARQ